jgi:hypothetical protein
MMKLHVHELATIGFTFARFYLCSDLNLSQSGAS